DWKHLSYASSLCGNCTEVCAVKINLHELLLENRHEAVASKNRAFTEQIAWKMWKQSMLRRSWMDMVNGNTKSRFINMVAKSWTAHRGNLDFPKKSFNKMWKEKEKEKKANNK
ncbi:MAG TPA: hypothetical protein VI461_06985, partial [Chitinophagaceae bacterium]|nr:hypothetical protein [Chitinophagaceae bacterium]